MRVNSKVVVEFRKERTWSQDELATAAGLNLRTIQRIENVGTASLQSVKSIASALEAELEKLIPETSMGKFEYKTLVLNFKMGILKKGLPDIQQALNAEGSQGWQLKQLILPSSDFGKSDSIVCILERACD
jgi:transcriptional regulator with XRE-family HTH domain